MKKITPLIIGIITGALMIGVFLWLTKANIHPDSFWQYTLEFVYAGGVAWTLYRFVRSANFQPTFKAIFGQGFRCFIIVTLIMVLFTWIFYASHPEIPKQAAQDYKEWSIKNEPDVLPEQREKNAANIEKQYVTYTVAGSVFAFLIRGAIFTAAGAAVILMRRKN